MFMAENSPDNPADISRNTELTEGNWKDILDEIEKADLFVALDLSCCSRSSSASGGGLRSDGTFDPLPGAINGKSKIVSLALPNDAIKIADAIYHYDSYLQFIWISVFKSFRSLKTVSGININGVDSSAFRNCTAITGVKFPKAGKIGEFAFAGCTSLASVYFPQITSIGNFAFQNCKDLAVVNFPKTLSISKEVFEGCTALADAAFPLTANLGVNAFGNTGGKGIAITLGDYAPNLWGGLFDGVSSGTVTVKIPDGASGYDPSWKKSFIGGNNNINVVIEKYAK